MSVQLFFLPLRQKSNFISMEQEKIKHEEKGRASSCFKNTPTFDECKKLAEILSPETADMSWRLIYDETHRQTNSVVELIPYRFYSGNAIPCWSLGALLGVLPRGTRLLKSATDDTFYHCDCPKGNVDMWFNNPVDACYELILKLHEQKLL